MTPKGKKIVRGFAFYFIGIILGIFVVKFFFKDRNLPNMWPEGRVKEVISNSQWISTNESNCFKNCYGLNDSLIIAVVKKGDVRFGISKPRRKPLPVYIIDGKIDDRIIRMHIESGDTTSTLFGIEDLPESKIKTDCSCTQVPY